MKIAIIGATGHIGQTVFKAAQSQGIQVTAIVRHAQAAKQKLGASTPVIEKDIMNLTQEELAPFDAIIDLSAPNPAYLNVDSATKLVAMFRENKQTRLIFLVGSSSLIDATSESQLAHTLEKYAGEPWLDAPLEAMHKLQFLQMVDNVDWTVITPQDNITDGPATSYRLGQNQIMTAKNGQPEVSTGNLAAALIAELQTPTHIRQQFTVVND